MVEKSITPDTMMKTYWSGNEEFADFYNAALFDGKPVIRPEELSELDSDGSIVIEHQEHAESLHRVRDMIKIHKRTGSSSPVLLGMENQTYICYPMPLRQMGYDYTSYHKEYMINAGEYKKDKTLDSNEFLSRMKRTDRFPPVITVVIYYGLEPWDGATNLREILDVPEEYAPFIQDYGMRLIEARCCDLKLHNQNNIHLFAMLRIAFNQDLTWQQAREQVLAYADMHRPEKIVLMTVSSATGLNIDYNRYEKEEDVTMRSVFDNMARDLKAEGKAEGRAEGKTEGRATEIVSIYREEGYPDQFILEKLQSKLHIAADQAMELLSNYGKQPA